jgi:hypothetical protein
VGRNLYNPEFCTTVVMAGREGAVCSENGLAGLLGVSRGKIRQWRVDYPEFDEACRRAKSAYGAYYETQLREIATTGQGSATAVIFALKNRVREEWQDVYNREMTGRDRGPIRIELSGEDLRSLSNERLDSVESHIRQIGDGRPMQILPPSQSRQRSLDHQRVDATDVDAVDITEEEGEYSSYEDTLR